MNKALVPPPSDIQAALAELLFLIFVQAADGDGDITPQEVRRFQSLLKDTGWTDSDDLRHAAIALHGDYSGHWARYASAPPADPDALPRRLADLETRLGADRNAMLRNGLDAFLAELERGSPSLGVFGNAPLPGRARAMADLRALLHGDAPPPRAPAAAAPPAAAPTAPPAAGADWPAAALTPGASPVWTGGKTRLRCVGVTAETHDAKTYSFVSEPRGLFHFKPGQFVTLELPIEGRVLRRSYTISSSPSRPYLLSITVKCVPKGWVSNWLFQNMEPGMECDILGPAGGFTCVDHPAQRLLFISGGSGVTPVMSMLRWIADTASPADVVFINNVRTPQDVIFHQELLHLATRLGPQMRLAIVPAQVPAGQAWNGMTGRFSAGLVQALAPDFAEREVFTCGPAGYMATVRDTMRELGHPPQRYHEESFGGAPAPAPAAPKAAAPTPAPVTAIAPPPQRVVAAIAAPERPARRVRLETTGDDFTALPDQTILEAAETQGIRLEHSCRSGLCGSCRMRCVSGQTSMADQSLLSQDEIAEGWVLTCITRAEGDIALDG